MCFAFFARCRHWPAQALAAALLAWPLAAAAQATDAAGLQAAPSSRVYVTVAGDTPDRVLQKTMDSSPLRIELLRQALAAANPELIPPGRQPRLKPGTVLQLPDHEALVRAVLTPHLAAGDAAQASPGEARRKWVRYP